MDKTAIITGVTGQDGSYLTELLLEKGYKVFGVKRRTSTNTTGRLESLYDENFQLIEGDICDPTSIHEIVNKVKPTEFYNLAAQSHVKTSFEQPTYTFQVNAVGVLNCLESIRLFSPSTRFYQASTSEMFGSNYTEVLEYPNYSDNLYLTNNKVWVNTKKIQNEETPFHPRSPYAVAKVAAHNLVQNYRESYGLHASCGILFNHESPRRGENFVTRKITKWLGANHTDINTLNLIKEKHSGVLPDSMKLKLGNLKACRDWGHARDYVYGMYLMLQQDTPDDYVLATGETHSIEEFLDEAFKFVRWDWREFVEVDPAFYRPAEVEYLLGDASKAKEKLGWTPKVTFKQLVNEMVQADLYG